MTKPTIMAVDDDPGVARAIVRDLRSRYGADYRVVRAASGAEALTMLTELTLRDRSVALVVSDQRMPEMTGIDMLAQVRDLSPDTKLLLLTAYADTDVAVRAINDIGLDYYMFKPWDPPEDRLYPVVDDLLDDWSQHHPDDTSQVRVVGHLWSDRSYEVKMFLTRNHVPYKWLDVEREDEARRLLELAHTTTEDLPLVLMPEGEALQSPTTVELADALGLRTQAKQPLYDLCIVGSGPAGLGGGGVRRVRRSADSGSGAGRTRRAGGTKRLDRELSRFPEGPLRRRSHPSCRRPSRSVRC